MAATEKQDRCLFCRIANHEIPSVIVAEDETVTAIMDINPATPGHILILPRAHVENIFDMPPETGACIMDMAIRLSGAIRQKLNPAGLNLIQSNGAAAGQIIFHFHLHLVPRYENDRVVLSFGHEGSPVSTAELEKIAGKIRSGILL